MRTLFAFNRFQARYLHKRRSLARQCRKRGMVRIKPGIWYDQISDVVYCQTALELERCEHIQFRRG